VSSAAEFSIRRATADDAALIARHRVGMFAPGAPGAHMLRTPQYAA
jgi:hypothetical protein